MFVRRRQAAGRLPHTTAAAEDRVRTRLREAASAARVGRARGRRTFWPNSSLPMEPA